MEGHLLTRATNQTAAGGAQPSCADGLTRALVVGVARVGEGLGEDQRGLLVKGAHGARVTQTSRESHLLVNWRNHKQAGERRSVLCHVALCCVLRRPHQSQGHSASADDLQLGPVGGSALEDRKSRA